MKSHVEKNLNKIKEKIFTIETIIQILIVIFRFFLFLKPGPSRCPSPRP